MTAAFSAGVILSVLVVAWVCIMISSWLPSWNCQGAPYLYATFHHDEKGVRKYSRDGCFLSKNVLSGGRHDRVIKEPRDLQVATYRGKEALYVVQAMSQSSAVGVFGACDARGHRPFLAVGPSIRHSTGLEHPYGITFDQAGALYVSCQHTNTVLRFEPDTFEPSPLPPAIAHVPLIDEKRDSSEVPSVNTAVYPGTFFQYEVFSEKKKNHKKKRRKHEEEEPHEGVRDVVFVEEDLWVASEDIRGVSVVAPSGQEIHRISFGNLRPVGLLYDKGGSGLVFVSSRGKKLAPVKALDPVTREVVREYSMEGLRHATGMVVHQDTLFVAAQDPGAILSFDVPTGRFLGVVASHFPDTIERLALSDC